MKLRPIALCLALLTATTAFAADNNSFDVLSRSGAKVATISYTFEKGKDGLKVRSVADWVSDGPGGARTYDYRLKDGSVTTASMNNMTDHTLVFFEPSKARDTLSINNMKNNASTGIRTLTIPKPEYMIAFNDDTSIWQSLLEVDATHPTDNHTYLLFVPAATAKATDRLEMLHFNAPTDIDGTLNGKPIALKHFVLNFKTGSAHVYADETGKVMQVESGPLGSRTHVRTGFALNKDTK